MWRTQVTSVTDSQSCSEICIIPEIYIIPRKTGDHKKKQQRVNKLLPSTPYILNKS